MTKTALVTGITGQDGAYLARALLERSYRVVGGYRRSASGGIWRLEELGVADKVEMRELELLDFPSLFELLSELKPYALFNLAAQSFVGTSFGQAISTSETNYLGLLRLLEIIRLVSPQTRFYQASTSEMFGHVRETPQKETTPFYPRSPYGVSKLAAHWAVVNHRESFGLHASSGILFNHESPLRGLQFVTRKITAQLAEVKHGHRDQVRLGNLSAKRDWGFAGDYVAAMIAMVEAETPDDYVIATGRTWTIRDFCRRAGERLGMDIAFEGEGEAERGIDRRSGRPVIAVDRAFFRPAEVDLLLGDPAKAAGRLGWRATTDLDGLVDMMAARDDARATLGPITA
ncbi:MAG: GDP-mannose 4,6-dehydratase [Azospirillaceae bacterium]